MKRSRNPHRSTLSRRQLLRTGLYGSGAFWLAGQCGLPLWAAASPRPQARARSVIQIWMWGGPSHLDTFDPKPQAGHDYTGPLDKPIKTNVDGIRIGQLLPRLAGLADKYTIIRSMTHGVFAHETASYEVQTGYKAGGRDVHPALGAIVSLFKGYDAGYKGLIPPYIVLTQPQGRFSEAGFLGTRFKPFATGGDPGRPQFLVEGIAAPGLTVEQQKQRRHLLHQLDALGQLMPDEPQLVMLSRCEDQAYDLIVGDAGKVFDPSEEPDDLRERYGRNTFGQSCLVARRLVEKGVPYVTINYKGWDTHKNHFPTMNRKLPELDRAMASLIEDLDQRGLLDSTIIWWSGEFGRTPKVLWQAPWNGGRGHWGKVFSAVVAGGGFKGGRVVGASDARGEEVKDQPVHPAQLIAAICRQLGIDPHATLPHPQGKLVRVCPDDRVGSSELGPLAAIM